MQDQYGKEHGRALALWMDAEHDRQTYYIKDLLRNQHGMERSDWIYDPDVRRHSSNAQPRPTPPSLTSPDPVQARPTSRTHPDLVRQGWYETWMAWEDTTGFPEWPLDVMADHLAAFLRESCGWVITVQDWTTEEGADADGADDVDADADADADA